MESFDGNTTGQEVVTAFASSVAAKTRSLGAETAKQLASAKYLILAGRNEAKIKPVIDEIRAFNPNGKTTFVQVDLASNESVRRAAAEINALPGLDHLDIVINAAGNMALRTYQTSSDGVELQFAANHLGHFLLTKLILDKILAAPAPTVVNLTSTGYELGECNFEDPNFNASRADVPESQLQTTNGVDMDLMMEGYKLAVARNNGLDLSDQKLRTVQNCIDRCLGKPVPPQETRTLQQGCATILLAALDTSLRSKIHTKSARTHKPKSDIQAGKSPALLFEGKVYTNTKAYALDKQDAKKLWDLSERLTQ
ncbi:hypothetical protein FHL15_001227 [Xylaria flabelliformis]|uniref:Uncharacterized protein n=1 Tax=Xylaria flabelliformis TaxID=2512241 RepID=A0A553ICU1_9PEZI|nr:hypothetical protein FHL15_001227 [Xylaria flabelliformis]